MQKNTTTSPVEESSLKENDSADKIEEVSESKDLKIEIHQGGKWAFQYRRAFKLLFVLLILSTITGVLFIIIRS